MSVREAREAPGDLKAEYQQPHYPLEGGAGQGGAGGGLHLAKPPALASLSTGPGLDQAFLYEAAQKPFCLDFYRSYHQR